MWLDSNGKHLVHWPIEEIETLRGSKVELGNITLKQGEYVEVKGITAAQVSESSEQFKLPDGRVKNICGKIIKDSKLMCRLMWRLSSHSRTLVLPTSSTRTGDKLTESVHRSLQMFQACWDRSGS